MIKNKLTEFIYNNYYDKLQKRIQNFCYQNKKEIENKCYRVTILNLWIDELYFKSIYTNTDGKGNISFNIIICPEIGYEYKSKDYIEDNSMNKIWLDIYCEASLAKELKDFKVLNVDFYNGKNYKDQPLSNSFVPLIKAEKLDEYATKILEKYQPDCINYPKHIDIKKIISEMGFNLKKRHFPLENGEKVYGRTYFEETEDTFIDNEGKEYKEIIPSKTIILDLLANKWEAQYFLNGSAAHEIIHAFYHEDTYKLNKIIGDNTYLNGTHAWMEYQANALAPLLLMPLKAFSIKANEEYKQLTGIYSEPLDVYEPLIESLSNFFHATKYAVKKRLINIGFYQVQGISNWMDGNLLRNYSFSKGALLPSETFTLSIYDFKKLYDTNQKIFELVISGQLVFAENHLVINDSKYVTVHNGQLLLTDYALKHLDECAYKFKLIFSSSLPYSKSGQIIDYLNKKKPSNSSLVPEQSQNENFKKNLKLHNDPVVAKRRELNSLWSRCSSIGEVLKATMKYFDIKGKELENEADVDYRTIMRYCNDEITSPNKRTVIAFSLGMKLDPMTSSLFLNYMGVSLSKTSSNEEDTILESILVFDYELGVKHANEKLLDLGLEPLTKEKI